MQGSFSCAFLRFPARPGCRPQDPPNKRPRRGQRRMLEGATGGAATPWRGHAGNCGKPQEPAGSSFLQFPA
eukprot:4979106-Alexandrium_andersonii.AAC.1